ncbi:hypothetical protein FRB98_000071 [Tulasnella sp. 332]|nr:hypothetical protein FRB98_000071 [Tulasnella sp. 332]
MSVAATRKVVILGAGFVGMSYGQLNDAPHSNPLLCDSPTGKHVARALAQNPTNRIQLTSKNPERIYNALIREAFGSRIASSQTSKTPSVQLSQISPTTFITPKVANITNKDSLVAAFEDASVVISLVGILSGSTQQFEDVQWKGVQNIVNAVKEVNARAGMKSERGIKKIIHHSAIGADASSSLPYFRTKGLAEEELFGAFGVNGPSVTVIRPSLIFGEGDGFFKRFATLAKYLPFLPVFGGGKTLFQPVFVGDIAHAIEILSRVDDEEVMKASTKCLLQAGGPDIFTYRQMMQLVLRHSHRTRPIISLPFAVGTMQGMILERLPESIFTVTQNQVEQLKLDNIVTDADKMPSLHGEKNLTLKEFMAQFGQADDRELKKITDILPTYL